MERLKEPVGGFAAGTLIHTREGLRAIEEIRVGDWVLSYPDDQIPPERLREKGEYIYRQVTGLSSRDNAPVCLVIAWDLGNDIEEEIKVTPNHPLYLQGGGWIAAGSVNFGNTLVCSEFANLLVKSKRELDERVRVHGIEVEGCCTYYVGKLGTWVHD